MGSEITVVYYDDKCLLGMPDLAQYTHMKYVADATEINVSVVCVYVYVCA